MVRQTEVNGRQNGTSASAGMRQDVMNFAHDLWSLAELQMQLFLIDLREGISRSAVPLGLLFAGFAFVLAAIPMIVVAIAWLLVNRAGFSQEAAFALLAVASAAAGAALSWW